MSKRIDYDQIAPKGVKALGGVYGYIMQSGLPAELVELVYLRVSQINNCAYCLDMHTRDLLKNGQKIEKLALVQAWAEAGNLFSERERAALAWAAFDGEKFFEELQRRGYSSSNRIDSKKFFEELQSRGANMPANFDGKEFFEELNRKGFSMPQMVDMKK